MLMPATEKCHLRMRASVGSKAHITYRHCAQASTPFFRFQHGLIYRCISDFLLAAPHQASRGGRNKLVHHTRMPIRARPKHRRTRGEEQLEPPQDLAVAAFGFLAADS